MKHTLLVLVFAAASLKVPWPCEAFSPLYSHIGININTIPARRVTPRSIISSRYSNSPSSYHIDTSIGIDPLHLHVPMHVRQKTTRCFTYKSSVAECECSEEDQGDGDNSSNSDADADADADTPPINITMAQVLTSALLVAGTTIGGGFLALPSVVAGSGFYPSATTLFGVWGYFLAQSFVLVECVRRTKIKLEHGDSNSKQNSTSTSYPGVAAVAKAMFGSKGELVIGILLAILIEATLVSQISRAGMLFPNYALGCAVSAISIAAIVFGPKAGVTFASKANSILTSLFLLSAFSVFGCGIGIADWSRLGSSSQWTAVPSAVPTFLQLLVYGEIVPTVCQILKYSTKHIHGAIMMGSLMTLCLQIGWSGLGIALVPDASIMDPVNVLLAGSGPVKIPLFSLAITAILTTILGSYLALLSTANDFIRRQQMGKATSTNTSTSTSTDHKDKVEKEMGLEENLGQRIKIAGLITIPATMIASTSPSIFLKAIDFAGSYPVLLLWGVIPPVIALLQRKEAKDTNDHTSTSSLSSASASASSQASLSTSGPSSWLVALASVSFGLVGINVYQDVASLVKRLMM